MVVEKRELRKRVADLKNEFSRAELVEISERVIDNLSNLEAFNTAKNILLYYSMPDEVNTKSLINTIRGDKHIFLPIVNEAGLIIKEYTSDDSLVISKFGIKEPAGDAFVNYDDIDMVVVPGVAFDRNLNRMGRGKGYYDGLLPKLKALKVAICFDFQLIENVPIDGWDVKMDLIVCESEIIK